MSDRRKPSPVEAWTAIDAMASQQELDRIKTLTEADLDRELAALGIDPAAARAVGQSALEAAARDAGIDPAAAADPTPDASARRGPPPAVTNVARLPRTARWVALAAAALVAAVIVGAVLTREPTTVSSPHPDVSPDAATTGRDAGDGGR